MDEQSHYSNHGAVRREVKPNGHRRAFAHDYREPGTYMVTMVTEGRVRVFGHIEGTAKGRPGTSEAPHMVLSELGRRVLEEEVPKISRFYPQVEVWRVAIMPDHIHLLLRVKEALPEGKHLGLVVRGFKTGCTRAWWAFQDAGSTAAPSGQAHRLLLFSSGYHDRIINRPGMLDNIKRYMLEHPLRARIREECPRLMQRQLHLWIDGREYAAFGNLFLLKYPQKEQVFFHRYTEVGDAERQAILTSGQLSDKERQHLEQAPQKMPTHLTEAYREEHDRLLRSAEEGTVLVTPGISKGESLVVNAALELQLPLILLQKEPITRYWKPSQQRFYACAAGYLLILAPWQLDDEIMRQQNAAALHLGEASQPVSDYARFHHLNDLARELCGATEMRILDYTALQGAS